MRDILLLTFVVLLFFVILKICSTTGYSYYYEEEDEDPFYAMYWRQKGKKANAKATTKSSAKKLSVSRKDYKITVAVNKKPSVPKKTTNKKSPGKSKLGENTKKPPKKKDPKGKNNGKNDKKTKSTKKPSKTKTKPKSTKNKPKSTKNKRKSTKTKPKSTKTKPKSTKTKPKSTKTKPKSTKTKPKSTKTKPKTTKTKKTKPTTRKTTPKPTKKVHVLPLYPALENYQVGAKRVKESKHPWVARVVHSRTKDGPYLCTAASVSRAIFITTARCLNIKVQITTVIYKGFRFPVKAFVTPSYPTGQQFDDIGIIVVDDNGFTKKWDSIEIDLIDVKRKDNHFKWFADLNLSKEIGRYRVVGYAAEKFYHKIKTADVPKYELSELDVFVGRKMCANILTRNINKNAPEYLVPCFMACPLKEFDEVFDNKTKKGFGQLPMDRCDNYHGVEGAAVININTNKLLGVASWGAYTRRFELPVGFTIPNCNNYFMDYECARKIRDNPKTETGSYQQVCDDRRK